MISPQWEKRKHHFVMKSLRDLEGSRGFAFLSCDWTRLSKKLDKFEYENFKHRCILTWVKSATCFTSPEFIRSNWRAIDVYPADSDSTCSAWKLVVSKQVYSRAPTSSNRLDLPVKPRLQLLLRPRSYGHCLKVVCPCIKGATTYLSVSSRQNPSRYWRGNYKHWTGYAPNFWMPLPVSPYALFIHSTAYIIDLMESNMAIAV